AEATEATEVAAAAFVAAEVFFAFGSFMVWARPFVVLGVANDCCSVLAWCLILARDVTSLPQIIRTELLR
ncbi:MAG: hypothetical protein NTW53_18575, partial [Burkholderiales bacterium]|nr:hypothetical protein [Burkholderiales bacterium]